MVNWFFESMEQTHQLSIKPSIPKFILFNYFHSKLNKTYIGYGALGKVNATRQSVQDANAFSVDEEIAVERALSKSSSLYQNSSWDLVDALENDTVKIERLKKEQLPQVLQGKTNEEIKAYVKKQGDIRKEIQKKIRELQVARKSYLADLKKGNSKKSDLESAIIKAIKTQAARKNYVW